MTKVIKEMPQEFKGNVLQKNSGELEIFQIKNMSEYKRRRKNLDSSFYMVMLNPDLLRLIDTYLSKTRYRRLLGKRYSPKDMVHFLMSNKDLHRMQCGST